MLSGQCAENYMPGYIFKSHYECAIAGYALSQESLKGLAEEEYYYGLERINKERLAIKFECRELKNA